MDRRVGGWAGWYGWPNGWVGGCLKIWFENEFGWYEWMSE